MVVPSSQKIKPSEKIPHKIYQVPQKPGFLDDLIRLELEGHKLQLFLKLCEMLVGLCEGVLNSTGILEELRAFDLIVSDSSAICPPLVSELLDVPRVDILTAAPNVPFSFYYMIPMPVSYVPQLFTGFTDKMTFLERVLNLGAYLGSQLFMFLAFARPMNAMKVKYNIKPERSFQEAVGDVELLLITADFALGYPQPLLPGIN